MHLGRFLLFLLFFGALCLLSYRILLSPLNTSSSSSAIPSFLHPSHFSLLPLPPPPPPPAPIQDAVSPSNFTSKSPFDHIYVISLANRADRREQMSLIASALQLNITFIDAMPSTSPLITYVAEQVHATRQRKAGYLAAVAPRSTRGRTDLVGGMGVGSIWLARQGQLGLSGQPLQLPEIRDWVKDLYDAYDAGQEEPTTPADEHFDIRKALFDPLERIASRQLNAAVLSTWWSHVEAWRVMHRNGDQTALFLEDDVDLEWDLTSMWAGVKEKLPEDWEAVFAGHCWGREMTWPTGLHPRVFYSQSPRCLHGYVLSQRGVNTILPFTQDPWTAFQVPIDVLIPTLLLSMPLSVYSIDPPFIIQSKELESDLQPGVGSKWRGRLGDSTMERIWRDQGHERPEDTWEAEWESDPAVNRPHILGQAW